MNKIFMKVSDEDAKVLSDSIVETEACRGLYDEAIKQAQFSPEAMKFIMDYYMHNLKVHKTLWRELLIKYIGEAEAAKLINILRFDVVKKVIFQIEVEGCALCK